MKKRFTLFAPFGSMMSVVALASLTLQSGSHPAAAQSTLAQRPAYAEWTTYRNPVLGYEVPIPPGVRAQTNPRAGTRCRFASDDGLLSLRVWGESDGATRRGSLEEAYAEALSQPSRRVAYEQRTGSGFVVAGDSREGTAFFEKVVTDGSGIAGLRLMYPAALRARFAPVVDEISRGFGWNGPRETVTEEDFQPRPSRPGIFSGIRGYFTGEDAPVAPRWQDQEDDPLTRPDHRSGLTPAPPAEGPEPRTTRQEPDRNRVDLTPPPARPREAAPEKSRPPTTPAKPGTAKRDDLPFGIPIPGKKGYVFSPYSDKQQVDVSGIPTGTKVKCPYTSKVFRVP